jgi:hypothetical protein
MTEPDEQEPDLLNVVSDNLLTLLTSSTLAVPSTSRTVAPPCDAEVPETEAEREAILACVSEEMAFILRGEDREDDAPELVADLQAAADRVRFGGR